MFFPCFFYSGKDTPYHSVPITANFNYTTLVDNETSFGSFTDHENRTWSIRYNSSEHSELMALNLVIPIHLAKKQEVTCIDLLPGEGNGSETGDTVGIIYKGFKINSPGGLGDQILGRDEVTKIDLGSAPIKGWDIGLVGMKRKGKRIIVVSGKSGTGFEPPFDKVPNNATTVYLVSLEKKKKMNNQSEGQKENDEQPLPFFEETSKSDKLKKS